MRWPKFWEISKDLNPQELVVSLFKTFNTRLSRLANYIFPCKKKIKDLSLITIVLRGVYFTWLKGVMIRNRPRFVRLRETCCVHIWWEESFFRVFYKRSRWRVKSRTVFKIAVSSVKYSIAEKCFFYLKFWSYSYSHTLLEYHVPFF